MLNSFVLTKKNKQRVRLLRHVPYALKPKVEIELKKLVKDGVLEKCDFSKWATPIVPVSKKMDRFLYVAI